MTTLEAPVASEVQLLRSPEVVAILGISDRHLFNLTQPRGPIPVRKLGRSVRYDKRDIVAFLDSQSR